MKSRRHALSLCLDAVAVVQIVQQFPLEVLHRFKFLQIQQFAFEQAKEIFHDSIIQAVALIVPKSVAANRHSMCAKPIHDFAHGRARNPVDVLQLAAGYRICLAGVVFLKELFNHVIHGHNRRTAAAGGRLGRAWKS